MSRCIAARSRGIRAPITIRAAPARNRLPARMLAARALLRSPWPTSTTPSPTGITSPPSIVAAAPVVVGAAEPDHRVAEARMEAVDGLDVERLLLARRPEHRRDRHAAVQPEARVAREQLVRQRREDEIGRRKDATRPPTRCPPGSSRTVTPPVSRVASSSAGISVIHAVSSSENIAVTSSGRSRRDSSHSLRRRVLERLPQQIVEEQDLDAATAHQIDERVVLLPRPADPDHVVEQQLVTVRRRQALMGEIRAVDDHRPKRSDLGVGTESLRWNGLHDLLLFRDQPSAAAAPTKTHTTTNTVRRYGQTNFR